MPQPASSLRVLVVDDEPTSLRICRAHLANAGYQIVAVASAAQARKELESHGAAAFAAVICDFRMPEEDGLSLIHHIRQLDPSLASILMTAEGEKELVTRALREGAQNFVDKPFSQSALTIAAARATADTEHQRRLRADATSARTIAATQSTLLGRQTAKLGDRLKISFHPRARAGGDFATVFDLDHDRYIALFTDISGHDLRAAFHSAYFQGVARGLMAGGAEVTEVFYHLNRLLLGEWNAHGRIELSLAACAVVVDQPNRTVQLLNCGLPNPSFSSRDGFADIAPIVGSGPLGWFDELPAPVTYPLSDGTLQFWSDGLEELAQHRGVAPLALAYHLHSAADPTEVLKFAEDDIIAAQLCLSETRSDCTAVPLLAESFSGEAHENIDTIQSYFESSLRLALPQLPNDALLSALLCMREGLLNALKHGCGSDPALRATLQVAYTPANQSLQICISDSGPGHQFDYEQHETVAARELLTAHRGLIMMKHLSRNFRVSAGGRCVTMEIPTFPSP